jgi:hypothetical protein
MPGYAYSGSAWDSTFMVEERTIVIVGLYQRVVGTGT